jgi:uncharacterized protein (DUF849 family)
MTKALARALAPEVRVLAVSPGVVDTAFVPGRGADFNGKVAASTPLKRIGDAQDIAAASTACEQRVEHIAALKPDICTLDLNTMNSGGQVVINTPGNVRRMAKVINAAGVKPEIELFDSGDIALMHDLLRDGTIEGPLLTSLVLGVKYGFQPGPETM